MSNNESSVTKEFYGSNNRYMAYCETLFRLQPIKEYSFQRNKSIFHFACRNPSNLLLKPYIPSNACNIFISKAHSETPTHNQIDESIINI